MIHRHESSLRVSTFRSRALASILCLLSTFALLFPSVAFAQRRGEMRQLPTPRYYRGVELIQNGNFSTAVRFYENELKGAMKIGNSLWIDSICYYAMLGETYYQWGRYDEATKYFNASLNLAMAFPNWTSKVTYTQGVSGRAKGVAPWGGTRRNSPVGVFPNKATIVVGEGESAASKQLGVVMEQHAMSVDPVEIFRCVALSIRRRIDILGPLASFDPISVQVLEAYRTRSVAPNHWSVVFLDVIWGLALESCDKTQGAVKALNEALLASGQFDHPLTSTALLELGHIFLRSNKLPQASECYYEAAQSAFQYGDTLILEEALRLYSNTWKGVHGGSADRALAQAYRWAKSQSGQTLLQTSLALELLEDMIYSGRIPEAKSGLAALDHSMKGDVRATIHADRWNYVQALFFYATGSTSHGDESLAKVVEGAKSRSLWVRQLMKLDGYVQKGLSSTGALTPRNAADLYERLLREPTVVDWAVNPIDSLSIQMIAPIGAYERQFQLLLDRDLKDKAFEVSERIRRERFFSTQTYGGRLVSLRYLMTADELLTTSSIRATRETLNFAYPDFEDSMKKTSEIMAALNTLPTVPKDRDQSKAQEGLFADLARVANGQEALLRFIAAGRVRIPYLFPPVYSVEEVQKRLPEDTAVLSFMSAEDQLYGFMIGKENLDAWRIGSTSQVGAAIGTFLKTIGNKDGSREVEASELQDTLWKSQGARLREILLGATDVEADRFNIVFSKLVVVPDSVVWYLPFEALCLPAATSSEEEESDDFEEEEVASDLLEGDSATEPAALTDAEKEAAHMAQYDDLDAAYYADDDSDADYAAGSEIDIVEEEESPVVAEVEEVEEVDEAEPEIVVVDEATDSDELAAPRRKSRNVREREAREAYESTLIPMIAAPDFTIRYSATVSLSLPNAIGRNAFVDTTLIAGSIFPKQPESLTTAAVERFVSAIPKTDATLAKSMSSIPGNLFASRLRRLVVWEEIQAVGMNWAPIVLGSKPRAGNSVSSWIETPWGAPRLIVAPALRTSGESLLKSGGNGLEISLAVLAMQASGADTMLLSRWRTGGRSSYDLSQEFVKNYEKEPAADAWKHAATELMSRDVVVEEEPRLKQLGRSESTPKYDAPFWWAGYLLIDSGEAAEGDLLEEFDAGNMQKAADENALLQEGDAAPAQGADASAEKPSTDASEGGDDLTGDDFDLGDASSEEGAKAVFVNKKEEGSESPSGADESKASEDTSPSFTLDAGIISDEDLQALDEEGDDFFATDDADDADDVAAPAVKESPKPTPQKTPQKTPQRSPQKAESEPTSSTATSAKKSSEPAADAEPPKSGGRLTLKGKGKEK